VTLTEQLVFLGVIGLAVFGGFSLYQLVVKDSQRSVAFVAVEGSGSLVRVGEYKRMKECLLAASQIAGPRGLFVCGKSCDGRVLPDQCDAVVSPYARLVAEGPLRRKQQSEFREYNRRRGQWRRPTVQVRRSDGSGTTIPLGTPLPIGWAWEWELDGANPSPDR